MNKFGNFFDGNFDTEVINLEELKEELLQNLIYLRNLSNREYLLHIKYNELKDTYNSMKSFKIVNYPKKLMGYEDVKYFIENETNDVRIVHCDTPELSEDWTIGRKFVSTMQWKQNPGRLIKFLIMINDKIAGFLSIGSDVISVRCRDKYIGWDKEAKLDKHMLNHSAIGTTIVPVQPLGTLTTGGKLLCLLLYHNTISDLWKKFYGETLVGMTTTSLFGVNSQYIGFPKYWKVCGETDGEMPLYPYEKIYKKMLQWLKINKGDELEEALSTKTKSGLATGPKNIVIEKFYKHSKFRDMWRAHTGMKSNELKHCFKRGVFYAKFYENTLEYLQGNTEDKDLKPRSTLDFDRNDINGIVKYWKRKWANRRWNKMKTIGNKNKLFMSLSKIENVEDFVKCYN